MHPTEALSNIEGRRKEDQELRSRTPEDHIVVDTECLPRRLWDLWSNRVVPLWVAHVDRVKESGKWLAVYHSQLRGRLEYYVAPLPSYASSSAGDFVLIAV